MINIPNIKSTNKLFVLAFSLLVLASSCKKDPKTSPAPITTPVAATRAELTMDSIFLYAKETYYWNDGMPTYDVYKPRTYSSNDVLLNAIRALPGTNKPFWTTSSDPTPREKYSFLDDGSVSSELGGVSGDYGFSVFYKSVEGYPKDDLRIKYVSPNSPAALKSIKRGYKVIKLNGKSDLTLNADNDPNLNYVGNAIFGSALSVSMTVQKPDGTMEDITISRAGYSNDPIFYTHIYPVGSKKVGYIVYNSFTTNSRDALKAKFVDFATQDITELIVDLRYNGGGSVATADLFTNLIAPVSVTGSTMYTTYWTKTMQDGQAKILSNQPLLDAQGKLRPFTGGVNGVYATYADIDYKPDADGNVEHFKKEGSASISKVYFLVLSGTASASELLINNLKGVMASDVKLIGRQTYGKPVGFFAIHIDKLDLYIPQFETKNSKNEGGYYTGMTVDYSISDDVTKDFGDPTEALLAAALYYSEKGTFALSKQGNTISSINTMSDSEARHLTNELDKHIFKGMIDDKLKLKRK